jgi:hypothetical protein
MWANLQAAGSALAVTPNDGTDLPQPGTRGIWVGGAGTLKVDMLASGTVTLSAVPAGTFLPIRVKRVYATGTSATLIVALY